MVALLLAMRHALICYSPTVLLLDPTKSYFCTSYNVINTVLPVWRLTNSHFNTETLACISCNKDNIGPTSIGGTIIIVYDCISMLHLFPCFRSRACMSCNASWSVASSTQNKESYISGSGETWVAVYCKQLAAWSELWWRDGACGVGWEILYNRSSGAWEQCT